MKLIQEFLIVDARDNLLEKCSIQNYIFAYSVHGVGHMDVKSCIASAQDPSSNKLFPNNVLSGSVEILDYSRNCDTIPQVGTEHARMMICASKTCI